MKFATKLLSGVALTLALISNASATIVDWTYTQTQAGNAYSNLSFGYDTDTQKISDILYTQSPNNRYWSIDRATSPIISINGSKTTISFAQIFNNATKIDNADAVIFFLRLDQVGTTVGSFAWLNGSWTSKARPTTATAVPEPEAYAMMLAGLGLVGFAARRKQQAA